MLFLNACFSFILSFSSFKWSKQNLFSEFWSPLIVFTRMSDIFFLSLFNFFLSSSSFLNSFFTSYLIHFRRPFFIARSGLNMLPKLFLTFKRIAKFLETCLQILLILIFSMFATTSQIFSSITSFWANYTLEYGKVPVAEICCFVLSII